MPSIFISYSSVDRTSAEAIAVLLSKSYDHVWYDRNLTGGEEWWQKILQKIAVCSCFIFLVSREATESEFCQKELAEALSLNKRIIPVIIRTGTVPEELSQLQTINMSNGITIDGLNQLYAAIIRDTADAQNLQDRTAHYEADLRLLKSLWLLIDSNKIDTLNYQTQQRQVETQFYQQFIERYLRLRDLKVNPQNRFINDQLERAFASFDHAYTAFWDQFLTCYTREGEYFIADSLWMRRNPKSRHTLKDIQFKDSEYNKTVDAVLQVCKSYSDLVWSIKAIVPEFDFPTTSYVPSASSEE